MSLYLVAILVCLVLVGALVFLLRTRRIREKYAAVWIVLTVAVIVIGLYPELAFWLSDLVGVQTPANLLFSVALVVLLGVCIQLSTEVSSLEEETRSLAEEIALLRLEVHQLGPGARGPQPGVPAPCRDAGPPTRIEGDV